MGSIETEATHEVDLGTFGGHSGAPWLFPDELPEKSTHVIEPEGVETFTGKKGKPFRVLLIKHDGKSKRISEFAFKSDQPFKVEAGKAFRIQVLDRKLYVLGMV